MHRTALTICSLTVAALLTGCGGGGDSSASTSASSQSPSQGSTPTRSSAAPDPNSRLPKGCAASKKNLRFSDGNASLDVTGGPDRGHYDLRIDKSQSNAYAAGDGELTGNWISADKKAVLFIDIEGGDPCTPEAFTRIGTRGANGPVFIDGGHNQCVIKLSSLSADGAQGTFDCIDLMGGGDGLQRDARGSFTLLT